MFACLSCSLSAMHVLSDQQTCAQVRAFLKQVALIEVATAVGLSAAEQSVLEADLSEKIVFLNQKICGFVPALQFWRAEIKRRAEFFARWQVSLRSCPLSIEIPAFVTREQEILPAYSLRVISDKSV